MWENHKSIDDVELPSNVEQFTIICSIDDRLQFDYMKNTFVDFFSGLSFLWPRNELLVL